MHEAELYDTHVHPLRDKGITRIDGLLYGTNEEDDNLDQILDSVIWEAIEIGRSLSKD